MVNIAMFLGGAIIGFIAGRITKRVEHSKDGIFKLGYMRGFDDGKSVGRYINYDDE